MTKVGRSYKQVDLATGWDAIVIGSGLGGLTTAALLASEGKRVLVLERHYVIGGFTHTFKRKGWEWDVGVHYIGEVHRERSVLGQLFRHITDDRLEWAYMGDVYDRIIFGEEEYAFRAGVKEFKESIREKFTTNAHAKAIDRYVDEVFEASKAARNYYGEKAMSGVSAFVAAPFMRRQYLKFSRKSTWDTLRAITDDIKLIGVLTGQYGDYGLPPRESSFAMHASVAKHYFFGGNYPVVHLWTLICLSLGILGPNEREYLGDDLKLEGVRSFVEATEAKEEEVIIFGWVVFPSKEIRDLANQKVPVDPRMAELVGPLTDPDKLIFDASRMVFGGFSTFV